MSRIHQHLHRVLGDWFINNVASVTEPPPLLSTFYSKDLVTGQTFGAITLINKHEFDIFTGGDEVVLSIFVRQVSA